MLFSRVGNVNDRNVVLLVGEPVLESACSIFLTGVTGASRDDSVSAALSNMDNRGIVDWYFLGKDVSTGDELVGLYFVLFLSDVVGFRSFDVSAEMIVCGGAGGWVETVTADFNTCVSVAEVVGALLGCFGDLALYVPGQARPRRRGEPRPLLFRHWRLPHRSNEEFVLDQPASCEMGRGA